LSSRRFLVSQWRALLDRFAVAGTQIITPRVTECLDRQTVGRPTVIVDEAHRFRNPDTNRFRALARLVVGSHVLLVTATPIHNCAADLLHVLRLFLRIMP